ncbi:MAG: hypothetical protein HY899_01260 [Deltaproteobacteria bacterium]|nr:hypothetical protein [Deltaproteobacteria bacterium]
MVVIAVVLSIFACLAVDYFLHWRVREGVVAVGASGALAAGADLAAAFTGAHGGPSDLLRIPDGVFLAPGHTWMRLERSGAVQLGAGQLPLRAMGELDALETAPVGTELRRGDTIAVLRHGQRELRLQSPVAGTVRSARTEAHRDPRCVQPGSVEGSWLCRVVPRDLPAALKRAFVAEEAREWMRSEAGRVRDFISATAARRPEAVATLADGGLPLHGLADLVSADQWQQFVTRFFEESGTAGGIDPQRS